MSWVRRDDQASIHRKVAPLDDGCYRLWSEAIEWCSRNKTDGRIGELELAAIKRGNQQRAAVLVGRGLWHLAGAECDSSKCPPSGVDGWVIHDYLDYNPSKAQVTAELEAKALRTARWRERRRSGDASRDGPGDASVTRHNDITRRARDASPSRPVPPRPEGGGSGTAPGALPAAVGAVAAAGSEKIKPHESPPCRTCGNAVTSAYHRNVCRGEAA